MNSSRKKKVVDGVDQAGEHPFQLTSVLNLNTISAVSAEV